MAMIGRYRNCGKDNGWALSTSVALVVISGMFAACCLRALVELLVDVKRAKSDKHYASGDQSLQALVDEANAAIIDPGAAVWVASVAAAENRGKSNLVLALFVLILVPACCVLCMLLPNSWKFMSLAEILMGTDPGTSSQVQ